MNINNGKQIDIKTEIVEYKKDNKYCIFTQSFNQKK